jgi:hypothetical protein
VAGLASSLPASGPPWSSGYCPDLNRQLSKIFYSIFSWIYSIWGPDFEAKRISAFVSKLIEFFEDSLLKAKSGFNIPDVAFSGNCESPL